MEETGISELKDMALSYPAKAERFIIKNNDDFVLIKEFLRAIKTLRHQIAEACKPRIKAAWDAHQAELAYQREVEKPLIQAEEIVEPKIAVYLREQERIRREAEERARKEAEERRRKEEKALRKAAELETAGQKEEAEKVLEPVLAEPEEETKEFIPEKPSTEGIALRQNWDFKIVDINKIPRKYLKVDTVLIGKVVRAMKEKTNIPGIKAFPVDSIAARKF